MSAKNRQATTSQIIFAPLESNITIGKGQPFIEALYDPGSRSIQGYYPKSKIFPLDDPACGPGNAFTTQSGGRYS